VRCRMSNLFQKFIEPDRIRAEKSAVEKYFGDLFLFGEVDPYGPIFFGEYHPSPKNEYQLMLLLPLTYPLEEPTLVVHWPVRLRMYKSNQFINDIGVSHAFHANGIDDDGRIKICHCVTWDASKSCVGTLFKGVLWLQAYDVHLSSGKSIDESMRVVRENMNSF